MKATITYIPENEEILKIEEVEFDENQRILFNHDRTKDRNSLWLEKKNYETIKIYSKYCIQINLKK